MVRSAIFCYQAGKTAVKREPRIVPNVTKSESDSGEANFPLPGHHGSALYMPAAVSHPAMDVWKRELSVPGPRENRAGADRYGVTGGSYGPLVERRG